MKSICNEKNYSVFLIIMSLFSCLYSIAQQTNNEQGNGDTVTLVTSGTGANKEEAINNALRSALEQAYGTFVSSNTQLVNDEVTRDEIVSISSGNIQRYDEISCIETQDSKYSVSVKAVVSIGKLVSFAQNHGASTELDGNNFLKNRNMALLNKKNEWKAVSDLCDKLAIIASRGLYDFSLNVGEPQGMGDDITVKINVIATPNENMKSFWTLFDETMRSLSMTESECENYEKLGMEVNHMYYNPEERKIGDYRIRGTFYNLRNDYVEWNSVLEDFIDSRIKLEQFCYTIYDNLGTEIKPFCFSCDNASFNKIWIYAYMRKDRDHKYAIDFLKSPILDNVSEIITFENHSMNNIDMYNNNGIMEFHRFDLHYSSNRISKLSKIDIKPARMMYFDINDKDKIYEDANNFFDNSNNYEGEKKMEYLKKAFFYFSISEKMDKKLEDNCKMKKKQICERLAKMQE